MSATRVFIPADKHAPPPGPRYATPALTQLHAIAFNTFLQSIRQPVFVVLLLAAAVMLVLSPALSAYTLDDDNKMLIDMGLSTLFIAGLWLAAFTAAAVLSTETDNKTVLTVISKPVSRPLFILGKYLGVSAALACAFWIMLMLLLLTVRHRVLQTASDHADAPVITFALLAWSAALLGSAAANYLYRRAFTSTFVLTLAPLLTLAWLLTLVIDKDWRFQPITTEFTRNSTTPLPQLLIAVSLVFQAVLILSAVAIAASTRLRQLATLMTCNIVLVLGLISQTTLKPLALANPWSQAHSLSTLLAFAIPRLFYLLVPNLHFLWLADPLTAGNPIPLSHALLLSAYSTLQITAILLLAVALFQSREVG